MDLREVAGGVRLTVAEQVVVEQILDATVVATEGMRKAIHADDMVKLLDAYYEIGMNIETLTGLVNAKIKNSMMKQQM